MKHLRWPLLVVMLAGAVLATAVHSAPAHAYSDDLSRTMIVGPRGVINPLGSVPAAGMAVGESHSLGGANDLWHKYLPEYKNGPLGLTYTMYRKTGTNLCLDIEGGSQAGLFARLVLQKCNWNTYSQWWAPKEVVPPMYIPDPHGGPFGTYTNAKNLIVPWVQAGQNLVVSADHWDGGAPPNELFLGLRVGSAGNAGTQQFEVYHLPSPPA